MGLGYVIGILGGVLIAGILLKIGEWVMYRKIGSEIGYIIFLITILAITLSILYIN